MQLFVDGRMLARYCPQNQWQIEDVLLRANSYFSGWSNGTLMKRALLNLLHTFHNSTFSRWHQIRFWTLDPLRKAENTRLFIIQRMIPGTTFEKPFRFFFVCSTNVTTNNTHAYLLLRKKALQWQTRILHLNGTILNKGLMDKLKSLNTLLSSIQTNSNWTKDALIVEEAQSELLQAQDTNEIISNGNLPRKWFVEKGIEIRTLKRVKDLWHSN